MALRGTGVDFSPRHIQPLTGGFDSAAIAAVRPAGGAELTVRPVGTVAPGNDGSAVAVVGSGSIQRCTLFHAGVGGVSYPLPRPLSRKRERGVELEAHSQRDLCAMLATAGVNCAAASRASGCGQAAIVELQVFAGQCDLSASAI